MCLQVTCSEFVLLWATDLAVMYGRAQAVIGTGIVSTRPYLGCVA